MREKVDNSRPLVVAGYMFCFNFRIEQRYIWYAFARFAFGVCPLFAYENVDDSCDNKNKSLTSEQQE